MFPEVSPTNRKDFRERMISFKVLGLVYGYEKLSQARLWISVARPCFSWQKCSASRSATTHSPDEANSLRSNTSSSYRVFHRPNFRCSQLPEKQDLAPELENKKLRCLRLIQFFMPIDRFNLALWFLASFSECPVMHVRHALLRTIADCFLASDIKTNMPMRFITVLH